MKLLTYWKTTSSIKDYHQVAIPPKKAGISTVVVVTRHPALVQLLQSRLKKQAFQHYYLQILRQQKLPVAIPPKKAGISTETS